MMETYIAYFHKSFYIPAIQQFSFHLPHVRILGTNDCGNTLCEEFKCNISNQDFLCCRDYVDRVVASFAHQIQSEYYGVNRAVSVKGI